MNRRLTPADGESGPDDTRKTNSNLVIKRERKAIQGRYKLEIMFGTKRVEHNSPCFISVWDGGGYVTGEGDMLLSLCGTCPSGVVQVIEPTLENPKPDMGVCLKCKRIFKLKDTAEAKFFRLPVDKLAGVLEKYYLTLKGDADIYLKFPKKDIRYENNELDTLKLNSARADRHYAIYTMKRLLDDTKNGASIQSRIKAFLTA